MGSDNKVQAQSIPMAYPPPRMSYPYPAEAAQGASSAEPPPDGYPVEGGPADFPTSDPATNSRGDDCCDSCWECIKSCCCCFLEKSF